ncbi:MAG: hypothetical protein KDD51_03795 [Bdellovibrionales bacterium]|nr:hypothetical protein [Bdellovibrionales bacterium]
MRAYFLIALAFVFVARVSACPQVLADIAAHVGLSALPPEKADALRGYAAKLEVVLDGDEGLERGLRTFLEVDAPTVQKALTVFLELDVPTQAALVHRLRWLGERGTREQRRHFIAQIGRTEEPLAFEMGKRIADHPELEPWIEQASVNLLGAHESTVAHLVGERSLSPSGPVSSGGGHMLASWEQLADDRIQSWPADARNAFEKRIDEIDIYGVGYEFFLGFLNEIGFDLSRRGWARHLVLEQTLWGVEKRHNDVLCLWLPRPMFNAATWKATVQAARHGKAPVGGKSLFLVSWSLKKIREAGQAILEDPNAQVLTPHISTENPAYYVRGVYDGVTVDIGLIAGHVRTLFPAWRQQYPATIGRAYLEWWTAYARAQDTASYLNRQQYLHVDLTTPIPLALAYLSRDVEGLSAEDNRSLAGWLDPKTLPESARPLQARGHQSVVFNWLSRERVVYRLEGQEGHLFARDHSPYGE